MAEVFAGNLRVDALGSSMRSGRGKSGVFSHDSRTVLLKHVAKGYLMQVFDLRDRLIDDYRAYTRSFMQIRDPGIRRKVEAELDDGLLWPAPLIQLNPAFEPGSRVEELVGEGVLHSGCAEVFRLGKDGSQDSVRPLRLHRHQEEAIRTSRGGDNYVLTTGTGSGKSLAYIVPIVDHVLRHGSGRGIQAIVVYPMNALANSQHNELAKFLCHGFPDGKGPVRFAKYTGQEDDEERRRIAAQPPDILLTNYVMLELILTRTQEQDLIRAAQGLRFLVLDELHTYRGRQGADVAMLIRRVREILHANRLQCVGTSATLAGAGDYDSQRQQVAEVASLIFGSDVKPGNVIGETLQRATPSKDPQDPQYVESLRQRLLQGPEVPATTVESFLQDPLSIWIESTFGLAQEPGTGRLVRARPRSLMGDEGAARALSDLTGVDQHLCEQALQNALLAGYRFQNPQTGYPVFAFRLHQFISRGDTVYASPEPEDSREITLERQQFVPGSDRRKVLLPLAFCRECGQEYYAVWEDEDRQSGKRVFEPRDLYDRQDPQGRPGAFLFISTRNPWPRDAAEVNERLPDDWLEERRDALVVRRARRDDLPREIRIGPDGRESPQGIDAAVLPAPFRFCLNCGVSYDARNRSDFGKLTSLGSEGRSTATTILSLSSIRHLRQQDTLRKQARKLLSFTDNRQDASLQAGHLNDFVEIGLLRSGLYRAVHNAGQDGLRHDELPQKVFDALQLPFADYASDPDVKFMAKNETERALRNVLGYRLYRDLQRGWRVTSPNLEQCGLLTIDYMSLDELCRAQDEWSGLHAVLAMATPEIRQRVAKVLLDHMRRELAIKADYLRHDFQERLRQQSSQRLIPPWGIDENEKMLEAPILLPRPRGEHDYRGYIYLSPRGGFGQYLNRRTTFPDWSGGRLSLQDLDQVIAELLEKLRIAGIVEVVAEPRSDEDKPGYQLVADAMIWRASDGMRSFHDPIRVPNAPEEGGRPNSFFVDFYQATAVDLRGIQAHEHTAQVPVDQRQQREEDFREARLPILYCSPTMELGVDIAQLNVVNMRNIPPTPANYAQRSGRAGRSGQPALVFTYCTTGSPHDQYFFRRPDRMVSGAVSPPRLDLANEDLLRAHVQAIWLAESGLRLGKTLSDVLDLSGETPSLELIDSVKDALDNIGARQKARAIAANVLATIADGLADIGWYSDGWLDEVVSSLPLEFNRACERWRSMYRAARAQLDMQHRISTDASRPAEDRAKARKQRQQAESQLDLLLKSEGVMQSDFYSYRYFASEGFLPGYNFPRLPISAYLPGRRTRDGFLSRPRFLAISEFGPRAFVYHEGSRYLINQVILPPRDAENDQIPMQKAKLCEVCGYLNPVNTSGGPDLCEQCQQQLPPPIHQLFRLENVSTRRRDKINCDEEERMRLGFEIHAAFRFAHRDGRVLAQSAAVEHDGSPLARLTYGQTATLWRINYGWTRRKAKEDLGFVLDAETGYWQRNEQLELDEDDQQEALSKKLIKVVPFVEDSRNCLIYEPANPLDASQMASLQAALKTAIQVVFQLEDNELAVEPLPDTDKRRLILFYEASEGGAGVLRRLIEDPDAVSQVAREALGLCHFDPVSGEDRGHSERARERCESACYDCLMSYSNQREHKLLDRQQIRETLMQLAGATVKASPRTTPRAEHLERLNRQAGSDLERRWLGWVDSQGLRLPSDAQTLLADYNTRPDFVYRDAHALIYIDGPPHRYESRQTRDAEQTETLRDAGFTVIRFKNDDDWQGIAARYSNIFGDGKL